MLEGVPRAPKAPAGCSVLERWFGWDEQRRITVRSLLCLQDARQFPVAKPSIFAPLQSKRASFNQRVVDGWWKPTLRIPKL